MKIGSRLYEDLFDYARSQGIKAITCEYNIQPPNPASQRFHDKFGFKELGQQWVATVPSGSRCKRPRSERATPHSAPGVSLGDGDARPVRGAAVRYEGVGLAAAAASIWTGGHFTDPNEQNTQQSPGPQQTLQFVHS